MRWRPQTLVNEQDTPIPDTHGRAARMRLACVFGVAATYCLLFLVRPGPLWPEPISELMRTCSRAVYRSVTFVLGTAGVDKPSPELSQGLYLAIVAGVIPLLAARLLLRTSLGEIGCRPPNRVGWRLLVIGFVCSIPFLVFMARGQGMAAYYLPTAQRAGYAAFVSYYAVNMLTEHFFCHGVLLAAFRADGRWPPPPAEARAANGPPWKRLLLFIGVSNAERRPGQNAVTAWLQLPPGCGLAIVGSAALFALVHVGKDWREAVLSLPGGLALAFIAYRGNSWLTPFLLHSLTAGTTLVLMVLLPA